MIKWEQNEFEEPEQARIEAYREMAEQFEKFLKFIKYASVGGMTLTVIYFGLKIYGVM